MIATKESGSALAATCGAPRETCAEWSGSRRPTATATVTAAATESSLCNSSQETTWEVDHE